MSVTQTPAPQAPQTEKAPEVSRRTFLRGGLFGAGLLTIGALGYRLAALPDGAPALEDGVMTRGELAAVQALALGFFPPGNPFGIDAREADVAGYVDRYLGLLSPIDQKIVRSLFWVYDQGSFLGRRFKPARLMNPDEARAYIRDWETSRLGFRRDLALSLRTVIGMAYFAHPAVKKAIGIIEPCPPAGPSLLSKGAHA